MAQAQREWFEKDYYKVLGVSESATESEIRRAYRKLAKEHHPDAHPGHEERFKEISGAYDVISDPAKRRDYDEVRRRGPERPFAAGGPGAAGFGSQGRPGGPGAAFTFDGDDLSGLFGNLFNRARAGPGGPRQDGMGRGDDLDTELHLSFADAMSGATTAVNITSEAACQTCGGGGAAPGTSAVVCPRCAGRGALADNQGPFSFSRACTECGGRGMVVESPCPTCGGRGVELRPRQVKVRIPAGVDHGQRIRLKGRGGAGRNGGPPGDLYVAVRVAAHTVFGRRGRDLTLSVPVTFAEAALGAEISVPTLQGPSGPSERGTQSSSGPSERGTQGPSGPSERGTQSSSGPSARGTQGSASDRREPASVRLKVPAGTKSGRTFRARGHGIASGNRVGDLLVTVEVVVPTELSDAEREAIQALSDAQTESPRTYLGV